MPLESGQAVVRLLAGFPNVPSSPLGSVCHVLYLAASAQSVVCTRGIHCDWLDFPC